MRLLLAIITVHLAFTQSFGQDNLKGNVNVDLKNSRLEWTGRKVGGEHYGEIQLSAGQLFFNKGKLTGGSFEIDMTTVTCTDLTDQKSNRRLVDHLKSEDFFSVVRFPKSTLVIKKVQEQSGGNYDITADLTIKGKTNPVSFVAVISKAEGQHVAEAFIKFDRSEYDVRFGSQSFFENLGDKMVYDDIDLKARLIFLAQQTQ